MLDEKTINEIYRHYLSRDADPEGVAYFQTFDTPAEVERFILGSDEFKKSATIVRQPTMHSSWKICILEEAKVIFVPIAKNAHTALMSAFMAFKGIDWRTLPIDDKLLEQYGRDDDKIHSVLWNHSTKLLLKDHSPRYVDAIMKDKEYIRIAVVRDPVDRIVSVCNHFFLQEIDNPTAHRHIHRVLETSGRVHDIGTAAQGKEAWLRKLLKFVAQADTSELDPHWIPQHTYISRLKMDHILPIERLDVLERIVGDRSGKKLAIGRLNVRGNHRRPEVSSELRDLIEDIYSIDRRLYDAACAEYRGM